MTHRADQIIDAVVTALQAQAASLNVPATNIFAHRSLSLSSDQGELPAITVNIGDDDPESELGADNLAYIDSTLSVQITGFLTDTGETSARRALLNQRRYIHVALMTNQTLGLPWVFGTRYGGAAAPELDSSTEVIAGSLATRWAIQYRMNITDPGD